MSKKIKVTELAKSLGVKSTIITDLTERYGEKAKKGQSVLEPVELDVVLNVLTQNHTSDAFDLGTYEPSQDDIKRDEAKKLEAQKALDKKLAEEKAAKEPKKVIVKTVSKPVQPTKSEKPVDNKSHIHQDNKPVTPVFKPEIKSEVNSAMPAANFKPETKPEIKAEVQSAVIKDEGKKDVKKQHHKVAERKEKLTKLEFNVDGTAEKIEIEKKSRHVDTRTSSVDLDKFDTEKIEEMIDEKLLEQSTTKMEKFKKNNVGPKSRKNQPIVEEKPEKKVKKEKLTVLIPDDITVGELAERMAQQPSEIVKRLMMLGIMATITQTIDYDTASLIAQDMEYIVEKEIIVTEEDILFNDTEDAVDELEPRSPVVVVMGHVDHGKTRLLDSIRKTNVIETEAGGITQHIGAYRVKIHDRLITFLDTPGHEAFTAMRARGAQVTDIAILVVAADDGIMPQTIEAINHAKAAGITVIVAINKIDKEAANPDNVKQQLTEYGLIPEEWGGDTICVPISALKGLNIDTLLEMVILTADMKELKANPNRLAKGTVIEAKLDKGRGPVATVLVQNGTLKIGDFIVAGTTYGRIRAMIDDHGRRIKKAGPCVPVEILGLSDAPEGGDLFYSVTDERMAKNVIQKRKQKQRDEYNKSTEQIITLDNLFEQIKLGEIKDLNIIIKADVQGSVEAMRQSLEKLTNEEVRINVIHGGVGTITESDIMLAQASKAIIIGFNVRPSANTSESAKEQDVEIRLYRVIYHAIEEMEQAMKGMLAPTFKEVVLGHAEIRQTYKITGVGTIAGSYVTDGKIMRNCEVRIVRDGIVIHEGTLNSLKRFKDDAKEVASGYECGLGIENFNDIKESDVVECFAMEEVERV